MQQNICHRPDFSRTAKCILWLSLVSRPPLTQFFQILEDLPSHSKNCVVRSSLLFFTAAEAVLCSEILRSQNDPLGPIVAGVNWNNLLAALMLSRDKLGFKSHMYACQIWIVKAESLMFHISDFVVFSPVLIFKCTNGIRFNKDPGQEPWCSFTSGCCR